MAFFIVKIYKRIKIYILHRMRIEVDDTLCAVYVDLKDLELADLTDFQKEGYGEFS